MTISGIYMFLKGLRRKPISLNASKEPPDLEEVWRDVNRRIAAIFGRRGADLGSGGGGGGGVSPGRQLGGGLILLVFVLIAIWLATGIYIVDESQRAVVLRFGKKERVVGSGLHWRAPYPVETHELVRVSELRVVEIGYRTSEGRQMAATNESRNEAQMLTDDENIVNLQFAVQYIIKDPEQLLFSNDRPDDCVKQAAESAIREIVGKSKMDSVLYSGREQIALIAQNLMQAILDRYSTGIQISKVTMQNAQPPEPVQAAFDDAVKAGQDFERQKNEGLAYANDALGKAEGTRGRLKQEADAYLGRVVATAEGDASRFKSIVIEYSKAPEVTRQRMYLDTMQQIFANTAKVIVDAKGNGNLLYLPLDKLMQAQAGDAAPSRAAAAPAAPEPAPKADPAPTAPDIHSRDALRSRDRGER